MKKFDKKIIEDMLIERLETEGYKRMDLSEPIYEKVFKSEIKEFDIDVYFNDNTNTYNIDWFFYRHSKKDGSIGAGMREGFDYAEYNNRLSTIRKNKIKRVVYES